MRASASIWSRYANRLFGTVRARGRAGLRRSDLRRREYAPVYSAAEVLEERALFSAAFGSAVSIGNDGGNSYALDVATDPAGNSYVTGAFVGTVDFDQAAAHGGNTDILTARGAQDAFVAKYAPDNSLVWAQRMGGAFASDGGGMLINGEYFGTDVGRKIALDGSGNVYVVGNFTGSGDFGSTTLTSLGGGSDGFLVKLNGAGTIQWAKGLGGSASNDKGGGVGVDAAGNVYAMQFHIGDGTHDIYKFSSAGKASWSESIATQGTSMSADMAVDGSGNVFVAGSFGGTVDFNPAPQNNFVTSPYTSSAFVLKMNTNGKFSWVTPFVTQTAGSGVRTTGVALDANGNVVVGGWYSNTVDFDPGSGTIILPAVGGGYVASLNSSGSLVWARALEASNGITNVAGLAVDGAGSIYAAGNFSGTVDLDPGAGNNSHTSAGGSDIFLVKLSSAGNFNWAETFGGTGDEISSGGIAVDPTGGIHLVGSYQNTVDFDPSPLTTYYLTNPGTFRNAFRLRLRQV